MSATGRAWRRTISSSQRDRCCVANFRSPGSSLPEAIVNQARRSGDGFERQLVSSIKSSSGSKFVVHALTSRRPIPPNNVSYSRRCLREAASACGTDQPITLNKKRTDTPVVLARTDKPIRSRRFSSLSPTRLPRTASNAMRRRRPPSNGKMGRRLNKPTEAENAPISTSSLISLETKADTHPSNSIATKSIAASTKLRNGPAA